MVFRLGILLILGLTLLGCTRAPEELRPKLHLTMPGTFTSSQKNWGIADPDSFEDYNCFVIFIEVPGQENSACTKADGTAVAKPAKWYGGFTAGSTVTIDDTESGPNQTISLIGFKTLDNETCLNIKADTDDNNMSAPAILGSVTVDLKPGDNNIVISPSYANRTVFDDCKGPDFNDDSTTTTTTTTLPGPTPAAVLNHNNPSIGPFTNVNTGESGSITYTVTNSGNDPATTVTSAVTAGSGVISLGANTCVGTLAVGSNCTITVNFNPTYPGSHPFTITLNYSDSSGAQSFAISDTATSIMAIEPLYVGRDLWNDYVAHDSVDDFTASNSNCTYASNRCIHAGRMRKVVTSYASCSGLTMSDNLNVFEWQCTMIGGHATFVSHAFKPFKGLRNLMNGLPAFQNNYVTLYNGAAVGTTSSTNWWSATNVMQLPDSSGGVQILNNDETIYVASTIMSNQKGWYLDSSGISIVTLPGNTLAWNSASGPMNCDPTTGDNNTPSARCLIFGGLDTPDSRNRLWIETDLVLPTGASPANYGILFANCKRCQTHNSSVTGVSGAGTGIGMLYLNSSYNTVSNVRVSNVVSGLRLQSSVYNLIQDSVFANHSSDGVHLDSSANSNTLMNVSASNNGGSGINVTASSAQNVLINTLATSNVDSGIKLVASAQNTIVNLSSINNTISGLYLGSGANDTTANGLMVLNNQEGLNIGASASQASFANVFAVKNNYGILNTSATAAFSSLGSVWLGLNATSNCSFAPDPTGLSAGSCISPAGIVASTNAGLPTFAAAPYVSNDSVNTSDSGGAITAASISDWTHFENPFRVWSKAGAWGISIRGRCTGVSCQVYDFQLSGSDPMARDMNGTFVPGSACPPESNGDTHILASYSTGAAEPYLMNAFEVLNQANGNNNGLCESNEVCLFSPNIGAYQGTGNAFSSQSCTFTGSTISNVKLYGFPTN